LYSLAIVRHNKSVGINQEHNGDRQ